MDYTVKKSTPGVSFGRRGPTATPRAPNRDGTGSTHSCNRLGCSTRYNSQKAAETSHIENLKQSSSKACSSRGKAAAVSSYSKSAASSSVGVRKPKEPKSQMARSRQVTKDCSECLELVDDASSYEAIRNSRPIPARNDTEAMSLDSRESDSLLGTSQDGSDISVSSTSIGNRLKLQKPVKKRPVSVNQGASFGSSVRQTATDVQRIKPPQRQYNNNNNTQSYGLKNLSCSSISDVVPSSCSASNSMNSMTRSFTKSYTDPRSSSSVKKSRTGLSEEHSTSRHPVSTPPAPARSFPRPTPRAASNRAATCANLTASARPGRASGERLRAVAHEDDMFLLPDGFVVEQSPPTQSSLVDTAVARLSHNHGMLIEPTPHRQGRTGTAQGSRSAHGRPSSQISDRSRRLPVGRLADRNNQQFSVGGVTEVLLALEQIEQDVDFSYEHLLLLETNLLLGGLGIHDRHREMRLDIDNMSYEELLALGEQIGTVTTALSEEELSKCLTRSIYKIGSMTPDASGDSDDDVKCCICQEEYTCGDDVGKLAVCGHVYHAACIQQWFQLKNWCPICKSSASSS